jgi:ectoine hydroxylase-related dioxygenase (phytanoyl-CoA dioxygenase family)
MTLSAPRFGRSPQGGSIGETPTAHDSLAEALRDVAEVGIGILAGALGIAETTQEKHRLSRAAERSEDRGVATRGYSVDPDRYNQRVFFLFNLDPLFIDLATRPVALDAVRAVIGDDFLISNFSANITGPGSGSMHLHADQGYVTAPWPPVPLAVNVAWLLDDFTDEVGATRYVPGVHPATHGPDPHLHYPTVPIEAPAGSLLIMDGRVWHTSGPNRTRDRYRAALFGYYVRSWIRPQVNWRAALDPTVAANCTPAFLDLICFGPTGGATEHL